jgi:hypothetical protein
VGGHQSEPPPGLRDDKGVQLDDTSGGSLSPSCCGLCALKPCFQNNGAQQLASEATVYIQLEDVNDEIPLFTEREQETVLEGEPIGTKVTQVNAIDKDGTFPNNQVNGDCELRGQRMRD